MGCDPSCAAEVKSLVSKSAFEVGCEWVLLGCDLGSVCVCVCFFFLCCDQWLEEEVWVAIWFFVWIFFCDFVGVASGVFLL